MQQELTICIRLRPNLGFKDGGRSSIADLHVARIIESARALEDAGVIDKWEHHFEWLANEEGTCPACGLSTDLIHRCAACNENVYAACLDPTDFPQGDEQACKKCA